MDEKQFRDRVTEVTRQELDTPEAWHYVSFADKSFKGAVIIKAHGINDALMKINLLQINPGGEVLCIQFPEDMVLPEPSFRNRLLSKEDVLELWPEAKSQREWEQEEE